MRSISWEKDQRWLNHREGERYLKARKNERERKEGTE
jgi:hypothetical protein